MQELTQNRIVIYAKDIMKILGLRERAARELLARLRRKYRKKQGQYVTIEEFCQHTGLKEERVRPFLVN